MIADVGEKKPREKFDRECEGYMAQLYREHYILLLESAFILNVCRHINCVQLTNCALWRVCMLITEL